MINKIPLFDLHCDTIYECMVNSCCLINNKLHIDYLQVDKFAPYIQCFAICVPEEIRGKYATKMFLDAYRTLEEQCVKNGINIIKSYDDIKAVTEQKGKGAIFTVENASVLAGDIDNISLFTECGVKFVTLTWNGKNELGAGCAVTHSNGLTRFGREVVSKLEENNMFIDLSHASDRLFYDVINVSDKPVVATHSNSRTVTNVKRNLTDKQFEIIADKKGVVGLNFHKYFLNDNADKANVYDILRHAEHFLSLGGEDVVSLGCDFDGCELPEDIQRIPQMSEIYELFLKNNYNESLVRKIFYENVYNFCKNFDK